MSIGCTDHTAIPRPNLEHDETRVPVLDEFGHLSIDETFVQTDGIETQDVVGTPRTPTFNVKTSDVKSESIASEAGAVTESPGCYFIRFVKTKDEIPQKRDSNKEELVVDTDELLPNIFSETDDEEIPPGTKTNVPASDVPQISGSTPSLVATKYALLEEAGKIPHDPINHSATKKGPEPITEEPLIPGARALKRCLTNEHDTLQSSELFSSAIAASGVADLSKRLIDIQTLPDTMETYTSQPTRCIALFPPTQVEKSPGASATVVTTITIPPIADSRKQKPERKKSRQGKSAQETQRSNR